MRAGPRGLTKQAHLTDQKRTSMLNLFQLAPVRMRSPVNRRLSIAVFQSQFAHSIEAGFHPNQVWGSKRNWFSGTCLRIASRLKLAILKENPPSSPKCSLMPIRRFPILCGLATDPVRPHCDPQSHALGKGSRRESRVVSLAL